MLLQMHFTYLNSSTQRLNNLNMHKFFTNFNHIWYFSYYLLQKPNIRKSFSSIFLLTDFWDHVALIFFNHYHIFDDTPCKYVIIRNIIAIVSSCILVKTYYKFEILVYKYLLGLVETWTSKLQQKVRKINLFLFFEIILMSKCYILLSEFHKALILTVSINVCTC